MAYSTKADARLATQTSRRKRSVEQLNQAELAIARHNWPSLIAGKTATCYVSMAEEPPTRELLQTLAQAGISVWVPIMKKGRALAWGQFSQVLEVNDFGVAEPAADPDFDLRKVNALIIPAQRAGRDGSRLGRGAGYYDRALAQIPTHAEGGPKRIVLVFDDEVDSAVPCEEWDEAMDQIVTPSQVIDVT